MATVSKGYTFGATEQVTAAKLHALVDDASVSDIVNADISAAAALTENKILKDGTTFIDLSTSQTADGAKYFTTIPTTIETTAVSAGQFASYATLNHFCKVMATSGLGSASAGYLDDVSDQITMTVSGEKLAVLNAFASAYDCGTETSASIVFQTGSGYMAMGNTTVGGNSTVTVTNLPFTDATSYYGVASYETTAKGAINAAGIEREDGANFKLTNGNATEYGVNWIAIGS